MLSWRTTTASACVRAKCWKASPRLKQGKCKEKSDLANFQVVSEYRPSGDQPKAIEALAEGVLRGDRAQTLLGVTGSGKTYTMANIIEKVGRPTLVLAHNKTLAAQLCSEFREFFPHNAVELKRTPPSTRSSTSCGTPPRRPFLSVGTSSSWRRCPAFTAWATPRSIPSWP